VLFLIVVALPLSISRAAASPPDPAAIALSNAPSVRAAAVSGVSPALAQPSDMTLTVGETADQTLHATDGDGDPLSFIKAAGPGYMTVSTTDPGVGTATGNVHLAPGFSDAGVVTATVTASDGILTSSRSFRITAQPSPVAPVLAQPFDITINAGDTQTQTLYASDANGDPLGFNLVSGPAYVTVTTTDPGNGSALGELVVAPGLAVSGVATATVGVSDGSLTDSKSLTITVTPAVIAITLIQPSDMRVIALGTADQTLTATDLDGAPLSFSKVSGPSYVTVTTTNPGSGFASGKVHLEPGILEAVTAVVTIGVSDGTLSDQKSFNVSIVTGNAGGSFGPPAGYGTEGLSTGLAVADLSGDGRLDVAVAHPISGTVSVLSGNGDGTFGATSDYAAGIQPLSIAVGDLNGDGWLDLAVTNSGVSVLLGGGGGFGDKTDYATGGSPRSVVAGDLNGDGRPDLAVTNSYSNTVSVLLGNGDGTFGAKTDYGTGIGPGPLAVGDLNRDRYPDLVVANPDSSTVSVLFGHGDGTFGAKTDYQTGSHPISIAMGDLNGDGWLDLAAANVSSGTVSVFLGRGDGSLGTKTDYNAGCEPASVAIGDLNGDGRLDLAVGYGCSAFVSVLLGNGDGTFRAKTDYPAPGPSVAIRDLNGDRRLDLVMAGGSVSVLLQTGPQSPPLAAAVDLDPNVINLKSRAPWVTATISPSGFDPASIDLSTLRLAGSVPAAGSKFATVGDHDKDGSPDLTVKFSRETLDPLLVPGMNQLEVTGSLVTGEQFKGSDQVRVVDPSGKHPATAVAPNPLNPVGVLTFITTRPGSVSVKMFDLQGRLVRILVQAQPYAAGSHEVRIDGRGEAGWPLSSGVYFYRVEAPDGRVTGRFAILK
jgi:hypothetical protein